MNPLLILMSGPPGSGKTTTAKSILDDVNALGIYLSPDSNIINAEGKYEWTKKRAAEAWAHCWMDLGMWLRSLNKARFPICVFDAMSITGKDRSPFINISKSFGVSTISINMLTSIENCITNDAARPIDRRVGKEKVESFHNTHILNQPKMEEGFVSIYNVRQHPTCGTDAIWCPKCLEISELTNPASLHVR